MSTPTATTSPRVTGAATSCATATGDAASPPHQRFFAAGRAQIVDEHDRALWEGLRAQTEGGKRFRPALLTAVYAALGGQDHAMAVTVGDAIELLHTAFVLHDDVIDGDQMRRGRPNVLGSFSARGATMGAPAGRARHYGETAGILAGDLALAGAVREVALCGAGPQVVRRLLDLVEEVLHRSAAGELADVRLSLTAEASVAEALSVAEWKTAAYSFQLPLQAAGILADADDRVVEALAEVGRAVGTAFQLRDDLLGVFGTAAETGKDPLCDLREGKWTSLIAVARSTSAWPDLAPHVGDPDLTDDGAQRARDLLGACGARNVVEVLIADLCGLARAAAANLPDQVAEAVGSLIDQIVPIAAVEPSAASAVDPCRAASRGAA